MAGQMIAKLITVKGCVLAIYYCPDEVYRMSIVDTDGRVLEFDDIFFCIKMATNEAKSIVQVLTR